MEGLEHVGPGECTRWGVQGMGCGGGGEWRGRRMEVVGSGGSGTAGNNLRTPCFK